MPFSFHLGLATETVELRAGWQMSPDQLDTNLPVRVDIVKPKSNFNYILPKSCVNAKNIKVNIITTDKQKSQSHFILHFRILISSLTRPGLTFLTASLV